MELGTIPNWTILIFKYRKSKLNSSSQKVNANKIYRENYFFQNKKEQERRR